MYEEVYIDLVFLTNLLLDYFLLRLIGGIFRCRTSRRKCLLGAVFGALCSCTALFMPGGMRVLLQGICAMWMLRIGCELKKRDLLAKGMIALYLAAFLWGGFWEVLLEETSITLKTFFLSAAGTYLGLSVIVFASDSIRAKRKNIYPVTLMFQGKIQKAYGFYDTGNLLTDPYSGKPVSIIEAGFLEKILSKDIADKLRRITDKQGELEDTEVSGLHPCFIPFRTVGKETGIMLAITLDELCIHTSSEVIRISGPVFGIVQESSALGNEYKVLLNSRFINQEGN